jgi:hypothetical protein
MKGVATNPGLDPPHCVHTSFQDSMFPHSELQCSVSETRHLRVMGEAAMDCWSGIASQRVSSTVNPVSEDASSALMTAVRGRCASGTSAGSVRRFSSGMPGCICVYMYFLEMNTAAWAQTTDEHETNA